MTLRTLYGPLSIPPVLITGTSTVGAVAATMDAVGEQVHCVGQVYLEGGSAAGSKTISSAGGKIHWRGGNSTWIAAGSTVRVGIQDVSTATAPAQGDGTFDVYADLVQGVDTINDDAAHSKAMVTGSKTIAHGDLIAVAFDMTVRNGADIFVVHGLAADYAPAFNLMPAILSGTPTFSRLTALPAIVIEFDDGSLGWFSLSVPPMHLQSTVAFNVGSGTADEYGNLFTPSVPMRVVGLSATLSPASTSSDFELCLYSDPLGSPVLIDKVTVDATQLGAASPGVADVLFATERTLIAGTAYGFTVRPTTANNVTAYYQDMLAAGHWKVIPFGEGCYAIRRLDDTGAFSDYNAGTAQTRRMAISLKVDQFNDSSGNAQYFIGI